MQYRPWYDFLQGLFFFLHFWLFKHYTHTPIKTSALILLFCFLFFPLILKTQTLFSFSFQSCMVHQDVSFFLRFFWFELFSHLMNNFLLIFTDKITQVWLKKIPLFYNFLKTFFYTLRGLFVQTKKEQQKHSHFIKKLTKSF